MTKYNGDKTKAKILKVAEKLFSEKGFDGTSVDEIARIADVNKALIYYHFNNKNDIRKTFYRNMIEELNKYLRESLSNTKSVDRNSINEKIRKEIHFLLKRKKIISIMMMESFKNKDDNFLFQCAENLLNHEYYSSNKERADNKNERKGNKDLFYVYEFFTGIIPLIAFVSYQDRWSDYFNCEKSKVFEYFVDSFMKSHIESHKYFNKINST